jgi:hypothetical protein
MKDLDWNMFTFLSWLERNKEAHTLDGLMMSDGYGWYNEQWKSWLHNSDAGKQILNQSGEITWWGGNTSNNPDDKNNVTGETTIEFPKRQEQNKPKPYNPNRAQLDTMTFRFYQEANCVDGGESEQLIVEAKSSLGIDGDGGAFFVLRTKQWAFDDMNDFEEFVSLLRRVEAAVNATNPTSIHVK